jgi:hypothetical protein
LAPWLTHLRGLCALFHAEYPHSAKLFSTSLST